MLSTFWPHIVYDVKICLLSNRRPKIAAKWRYRLPGKNLITHYESHSLTHPLVKISLRRRHALMVEDGAFSHKLDYVLIFRKI